MGYGGDDVTGDFVAADTTAGINNLVDTLPHWLDTSRLFKDGHPVPGASENVYNKRYRLFTTYGGTDSGWQGFAAFCDPREFESATGSMKINKLPYVNNLSSSTLIQTLATCAGDPIITPIYGASFQLPCDTQNYILFDNQDLNQRLIINVKLQILPEAERQEIQEYCNKVWNRDCNILSYMKYISVYWDGEWTSYDMDTLSKTTTPSNNAINNFKLGIKHALPITKTNRVISWYNEKHDTEMAELSWQTNKHGTVVMNLEKYSDLEIRSGTRLRGTNITKENSFGALVSCADFKKLQINKPLNIPKIQNDYTHNLVCKTGHIQYRDGLITRTLLQKESAASHLLK